MKKGESNDGLTLGPSGEAQTRGLLVPNQAFYQLNYTRIFHFARFRGCAQPRAQSGRGALVSVTLPIIHIFFRLSNVHNIFDDFFLKPEYNKTITRYWGNFP